MPTLPSSLNDAIKLAKPGDVVYFQREGLMGLITTILQGNTDGAHVAMVLPNGKLASTGAVGYLWYGEESMDKLKGRSFSLLRPVEDWTVDELTQFQVCHNAMMNSGMRNRFYGLWRYGQLLKQAAFGKANGIVNYVNLNPPSPPQFAVCSWVVGWCLWSMGATVGKMFGKVNYTGLIPEDFGKEADAVDDMRNTGGFFKPGCKYLYRAATFVKVK